MTCRHPGGDNKNNRDGSRKRRRHQHLINRCPFRLAVDHRRHKERKDGGGLGRCKDAEPPRAPHRPSNGETRRQGQTSRCCVQWCGRHATPPYSLPPDGAPPRGGDRHGPALCPAGLTRAALHRVSWSRGCFALVRRTSLKGRTLNARILIATAEIRLYYRPICRTTAFCPT